MNIALFQILERDQLIILLLNKPRVIALSPKDVSMRIVLVYCLHTRLKYCCSWSKSWLTLVQLQHR